MTRLDLNEPSCLLTQHARMTTITTMMTTPPTTTPMIMWTVLSGPSRVGGWVVGGAVVTGGSVGPVKKIVYR